MTNVSNPTGPSNVNAVSSAEPTQPGAAAPAGLPDPITSMILGDDAIAQIVGLMSKSYRQDRKDAKQLANLQEKAIAKETAGRIAKMRESAEQQRSAALVKGLTMVAGGAAATAGAAMSLGDAGSTTTRTWDTLGDGTQRTTEVSSNAAKWAELGSGISTLSQGSGELVASYYTDAAASANEDALRHEASADVAKRSLDEHKNEADDARRMLDKVAEFLKAVRDSQNASAQSAIRRA